MLIRTLQRSIFLRTVSRFLLLILFTSAQASTPQNFIYVGAGNLSHIEALIKRDDIDGVQVIYNWKMLEKSPDDYDFAQIEADLRYLNSLHKKLFIQIQDRFFAPQAKNVPHYLLNDAQYQGGIAPQYDHSNSRQLQMNGWVAKQWHPAVQQRYQKLLAALAKQFDGRVLGINLAETAIDVDLKNNTNGFSCDKYFNATLENMRFARSVFKNSYVAQYVNFWPCEWNDDHRYMSRLFDVAYKNGIGLGGPDIVPNKKAQMKNSYPFFHRYKGKLNVVAMAVQEPTLAYINPKTKKPFTRDEFYNYAKNYLGVDIIFWSTESPWLNQHASTTKPKSKIIKP